MSCIKSFTYHISDSGGGLFFGLGTKPQQDNVKYYIDINILSPLTGDYKPVKVIADSVTGDSMLYWKEDNELKYGSMEELFINYHDSLQKDLFQVLTVENNSANTAKIVFKPISDVTYHGIKDVWKVIIRNGKSIKVTQDHSLIAADAYSKKMTAKSFNDIGIKGAVISVDDYNIDNKKIPIDNNMLTFMGLWMADGSYEKLGKKISGIRISTGGEQNILNWLTKFSCNYNEGEPCLKYSQSRNGDVFIHRMSLGNQLLSEFGDVDSYTKRVPKFIFTASNEQIAAFLKGYFSGDGSIHICNNNPKCSNFKYGSYYAVDCTCINRQLLEDISILLDRLGIKHNISTPFKQSKTGYKSNQLFYKLIIHAAPSVKKFVEKIGLIKKFEYKDRESYKRDKKQRPVSLRQIRTVEYIGKEPVYDIVGVFDTSKFVINGICVSNTGNDITLITKASADYIGFHPSIGALLEVSGIREGMVSRFKKINTYIQLGNLRPVLTEVGFALDKDSLQENLLGNKGVLSSGHFQFIYSKNSLKIIDNVNCGGTTTSQYAEKSKYGGGSSSRRPSL